MNVEAAIKAGLQPVSSHMQLYIYFCANTRPFSTTCAIDSAGKKYTATESLSDNEWAWHRCQRSLTCAWKCTLWALLGFFVFSSWALYPLWPLCSICAEKKRQVRFITSELAQQTKPSKSLSSVSSVNTRGLLVLSEAFLGLGYSIGIISFCSPEQIPRNI